ncbi:MAG TPA: hypothetical protein VNU97_17180 [Rhizomicrobium sp.]|jgi:hypothetical protein|nr:hypothetical protein [Rhizomicrobium sp.]
MSSKFIQPNVIAPAALLAASPALADVHGEIIAAIEHVEYSAAATDIATAHMHLHHTLNCLVGPGGAGFAPKEINPCANAGHGIIPDTTDAKARSALEAAAAKTRDGLLTDDLATARADAAFVAKAEGTAVAAAFRRFGR